LRLLRGGEPRGLTASNPYKMPITMIVLANLYMVPTTMIALANPYRIPIDIINDWDSKRVTIWKTILSLLWGGGANGFEGDESSDRLKNS
jgi:hypothetical protein